MVQVWVGLLSSHIGLYWLSTGLSIKRFCWYRVLVIRHFRIVLLTLNWVLSTYCSKYICWDSKVKMCRPTNFNMHLCGPTTNLCGPALALPSTDGWLTQFFVRIADVSRRRLSERIRARPSIVHGEREFNVDTCVRWEFVGLHVCSRRFRKRIIG